jgi:cell division protein FtsZ
MINIKMQPSDVKKLSPKIAVIGVGGAGGNAVNNMISSNLEGCEFLVCNTDAQALEHSLSDHKIQLGAHVTGGLGAGSKPEIGKAAAEESLEEVLQYLDGANMAFVTAGMGGGTGTGAAPVIAKACRERGILTVGVVTKPFHFEGTHRMRMAEAGIEEMQAYVDTLIVIPNQNLFRIANEKTTFAEAFRMADGVLQSGVRGVTDLMVRPGLVNLDFADIRTAMLEMGKAMMGTGEASGEKRAIEAAEAAINNPLLDDVSMKGAHGVIINVTGGYDMTLFEADEACNRIRDEVDPDANIIFGATFDDSLEGVMRVSIVATGIEKEAVQNRKGGFGGSFKSQGAGRQTMERAQPKTEAAAAPQTPAQPPVTAAASAPQMPRTYGSMAAQNVRGITAPAPLSAQVKAQETPAAPEPEAEMFEQQRFSDVGPVSEDDLQVPQNTAMRGTRYKDSFIPPKPVEAEQPNLGYQSQSFHDSQHKTQSFSQKEATSSLKLSPPRQPSPQAKRSPSLFERITGTVQQHLEGLREDAAPPRERTAPSARPSGSAATATAPAAQGRLNIDAPARPKEQPSDELDIPAFLRRQAN